MVWIFGAALAGLTTTMAPDSSTGPGPTRSPKYHHYNYEAACGPFVFKVRFRNGRNTLGRVDFVSIDGRPLAGAATTLNRFAARRAIDQVGIMNCGLDPLRPVFRGSMGLRKPEAEPSSSNNAFYFRIIQEGRRWRFVPDRRS